MSAFTCADCGAAFQVPAEVLARYPGWSPRQCRACRPAKGRAAGAGGARRAGRRGAKAPAEHPLLTPEEVLARFPDPGEDGVYTDGSCSPNPGPGGWGVVWVEGGRVRAEAFGQAADTTNNRMELQALIEAYRMLPEDAELCVFSDSNLCVQTVRDWAPGWAARGWKRKTGPIANLDLVKELYTLACARPRVELRWIAAHAGHRWNEYADALASTWMREASGPRR
jgi:ribonuclease HI